MSSLPPKFNAAELQGKSQLGKAGATVNKFAKRDPSLYPLIIIVSGIFATAGYFLTSKSSAVDPAKKFMSSSAINNWEDPSKLDVHPSQVAAFKYRYRNKQGVMEDSLPVLNSEVRKLATDTSHKFRTD